MEITKRHVADITILDLKGKLTTGGGAELLRDTVTSIVFQGDRKVVLNLAGVTTWTAAASASWCAVR